MPQSKQNKQSELLFITASILGDVYYLEDAYHHLIGRFNSEQEARDWCKENNYKVRVTN